MLRPLTLLLSLIFLSACGFHLRGREDLPAAMQRIQIDGISRQDALARSLDQILKGAGGTLTKDAGQATMVLHVFKAREERTILSLSQGGRANAYDLIYLIDFEVKAPDGTIILPRQDLQISRNYFNSQVQVVGQLEEENQMRGEMHSEAAQALYQRLIFKLINQNNQTKPSS